MKANHNPQLPWYEFNSAVINIRKSKNESKSQQININRTTDPAVINIRKSKNESKSQHAMVGKAAMDSCDKYQKIKE